MNNIKIKTFIHTIFIIAIVGISASFWLFWKFDATRFIVEKSEHYRTIANSFFTKKDSDFEIKYGLIKVIDNKKKLSILSSADEIYIITEEDARARVYEKDHTKFIYLQKFGQNNMYQLPEYTNHLSIVIIFTYIVILMIILTIYISFLKKLKPLIYLRDSMSKFSDGNMSVHVEKLGDDEIGEISEKFNESVEYIKKLLESKNLFMRNMMHELKTPITKGLIAIETLPDVYEKSFLKNSYIRMNEIISDLAHIEKISSGFLTLEKKSNLFSDIVVEIERTLMHENRVKYIYEEFEIEIDKKLLALALKNLIDNAIKFGQDEVVVKADALKIEVISTGEALKYSLEFYTEPFNQDKKQDSGFGLGLYIVNQILELHHFKLAYDYDETASTNIFSIRMS
jgi:two-component system OmpR family sensor kinase